MREKLTADSRVRRVATHLVAAAQGETIILHCTDGTYFGLNATGSRVWELIAEACAISEIVATMVQEYSVSEAALLKDIEGVLSELQEAGLVEVQTVVAE